MATRLNDSLALVEQTVGVIRNVMAELQPPVLHDYGLSAALRWYAARLADRAGLAVAADANDLSARLDRMAEVTLFRVAQEALTNAVKHARAGQIGVSLREEAGLVVLTVADDGCGFRPGAPAEKDAHLHWGLLSMRERVEAIGGAFRIETAPGRGTRVVAEVQRASPAR
jgi:signal transduction histidine kinase